MEQENNKEPGKVNGEPLYSKDMFYTDLLECQEVGEDKSGKDELMRRDILHKRKVLQSILYLDEPGLESREDLESAEEFTSRIEAQLEEEELLFCYTFYVSSNHNFDYTWSYMRKQFEKFASFLFVAKRFLRFVHRDIKTLAAVLESEQDIHIVFAELIDVNFTEMEPHVKIDLKWEHFHHITQVADGYRITVMKKAATLAVINCSYAGNPKELVGRILNVLVKFGNGK